MKLSDLNPLPKLADDHFILRDRVNELDAAIQRLADDTSEDEALVIVERVLQWRYDEWPYQVVISSVDVEE